MKLRLGEPVHATDGLFGEIGDIVVDPVARSVTHLVVQPHNQHYQARLVPIGLVTVDNDAIRVGVDLAHLRHLQRVADSEFVQLGEPIDVGLDWDIGTEDVVFSPSTGSEFGMSTFDDHVTITYDRIPKGDCEIRDSSSVWTSDDKLVGTVEGFIADDEDLAGVVVRAGRRGLRHYIVVPMNSVAKVRSDLITLSLDHASFQALPETDDIFGADNPPSAPARIEHRASRALRSLQSRLGARFGRS